MSSGSLDAFHALVRSGLGVLDIGARGGAHAALAEVAPLVNLIGFEPDTDECVRLNAQPKVHGFRSVSFLPHAVAAVRSARILHVCRAGGASSLFEPRRSFLDRFPDSARFDVLARRSVETRSIDDLKGLGELPSYVGMIKIDTQGTELEVLNGASTTLAEVAAVEVEVEFAPLYESQPLFRDVDRCMAERGFSLFKLRRMHWVRRGTAAVSGRSAGQIVFGDALYLRDPLVGGATSSIDARQAEALVLLACVYDCHDFALELVADRGFARMLDVEQVRRYVLDRIRRSPLGGLWKRRGDRMSISSWLHGYRRSWSRGDTDFYGRI
jgi:FkbM family methyltransferase